MLLVCTVGMAVCTVAASFVYRVKDASAQAASRPMDGARAG
jgi:hypothetical protein